MQKIKKSYPSSKCLIGDLKLKPDLKNFKTFLKKHGVVVKQAHSDIIGKSTLDLY